MNKPTKRKKKLYNRVLQPLNESLIKLHRLKTVIFFSLRKQFLPLGGGG